MRVCVCALPAAEFHLQQRGREDKSAVRCQYAMVQISQPDEAPESDLETFGGESEMIWVVPCSWVAIPNQEYSPGGRPGSPSHLHMIPVAWSARNFTMKEKLSKRRMVDLRFRSVDPEFQIICSWWLKAWKQQWRARALPFLHRWLVAPMSQWHTFICKGLNETWDSSKVHYGIVSHMIHPSHSAYLHRAVCCTSHSISFRLQSVHNKPFVSQ